MKLKVPRMIHDYLAYLPRRFAIFITEVFAKNFIRVGSNADANNDHDR